MLKWPFKKVHIHDWRGSCFNRFGVTMEETCQGCGEKRHLRDFKDSCDDNWQDGPNPIAEQMRRDGVTCNY